MFMKGSYILIIHVKKDLEVKVDGLGKLRFKAGYYAYVGSAMNSLEARIARHLRKNNKKLWWHVDYLLANESAHVVDVLIRESDKKEECSIARELAERFEVIRGFGSSDCKCEGHLFYLGKN
jgi:Uri superfamily endonuclease